MSKFLLLFIKYHIDISKLDFLNSPAYCNIKSGLELLKTLGAFDETGQITSIGLQMCDISLSPRFSRILVEVKNTLDNQLMLDTAICCLLLELNSITSDYKVSSLYSLKSDLFYQLECFKHLNKYCINPYSIDYNNLKRIKKYLPKILSQIGCKDADTGNTDYECIRKYLAYGFPDNLFIFDQNKRGFVNDVISTPRIPYKNSTLTRGNHFLVGIPLNISNTIDTPTNNYKRLILSTSYSLDEVLTNFADLLTKKWSIDNDVIIEHVYYHDLEITSYSLGTVDELRASRPEEFHVEEKDYPKFNQSISFLYFHDLKIKSI